MMKRSIARTCFGCFFVLAVSLTALLLPADAHDPVENPLWYRCSHNWFDSDASSSCTEAWSSEAGGTQCNISAKCPDDDDDTTTVRTYLTVDVTEVADSENCDGVLTNGSCG